VLCIPQLPWCSRNTQRRQQQPAYASWSLHKAELHQTPTWLVTKRLLVPS
jgi:hypothetical protein